MRQNKDYDKSKWSSELEKEVNSKNKKKNNIKNMSTEEFLELLTAVNFQVL